MQNQLTITNFIDPYGIIYMIRNKVNDKKYIGQTIQKLKERSIWTKASVSGHYQNNPHLISSINKYGFENFERMWIDVAHNQKELNEKEDFYIRKYNTIIDKNGYNMKYGGAKGKHSKELKQKISRSNKKNTLLFSKQSKERWKDPIFREKTINSRKKYYINNKDYKKGKSYEELYGIERAKEIKEKISKKVSGKNNPWYGKTPSIETINKMKKSSKKRWTDENRKKHSEIMKEYYKKTKSKK